MSIFKSIANSNDLTQRLPRKCFSRFLMLIALITSLIVSSAAYAQIQNEVQTTVLFDGTTGFLATDPTAATGVVPEPHTPGEDGSANNLVVRTHDQFAVRVDWNINERDATNVVLTIELPTAPDDVIAEWTVDSTLGYAGCVSTTFTPPFTTVGGGNTGAQTVECTLEDQPEGSNGTIRLTALLNESTDDTTFDVVSTLTTTEDPLPGVSDGLDQELTVSAIPIATFRKGTAEVAGDPSTGPITSGGEDGILFLYPLSLIDFSQGPNPIIGAGPIGGGQIDFFDHAYRLTDSVSLATQQQMDDAGFVGRTPCGPYDGAGAFPDTPSASWACGGVTSPNGYPVVPISVTGLVANPAPALNEDGTPNVVGNGVNVLAGQIAFWLPADEVQDEIDDPDNDSSLSARFENAIASQGPGVEITDQADVLPIGVPDPSGGTVPEQASTSDPGEDPTENTSRTILGAAPPTGGGPGASIGHHVIFRGGPLQILESTLYNGDPRFGLDYRTVANGGLRGLLPGEQVAPANTNGDSIGDTPRGNIVTINSQVLALSTSPDSPYDAPIQGCTAFDTTHYDLVAFGDIPVTQTDGTGGNTNPTVIGGSIVPSNTGPLAHVYTGAARTLQSALGGQQNAVGGYLTGLDYTVEFTDAPLELLPGGNYGVNNDELTCNDSDMGPSGWIDANDPALTTTFDADGDGVYVGITRARVRITQRFPWAEGPDGPQDFYKGFQAFFQAMVKTDLMVQTVNQELFALQSHSFGDLGVDGVPDLVPFIGQTAAIHCRPYSQSQWQATGNDLASSTGYCNNSFIDDGADPLDDTDLVDWDNNSATRFSTNATSGITTFLNSSGAVITIVEANLGLSKTNRDGLADIADNGDIVEFIIRPSVVGSNLEALTNVRLSDNLPANYEFVQFTQLPDPVISPGATCTPPPTPSGILRCQFSEPNPLVDTGLLPAGIPGGWSDEIRFEVMVVGAIADPDTPTVITNTARIDSTALGPWDPTLLGGLGDFSNPSAITAAPKVRTNSARSFLPLPADEGVIVKTVADLAGECQVIPPGFTGTLPEWQERCSLLLANQDMVFDLSVTNEGNTAFTRLEFIDVLPHIPDGPGTEEPSNTSVGQLGSSRPPTVGDGRSPASNFTGPLAFVSLVPDATLPAGVSLAEVWVTADDPNDVSRDPDLSLGANTWCDGVGGPVVSGPAGACPATPEDVTGVYGLLEGDDGLLPGETATLTLTLDPVGIVCEGLWTNTFGLRMDEILLPIRSNDVSVMATGCDLADLEDTYSTLLVSNGPLHSVVPGLALGAVVDTELDGQVSATDIANGDDNNTNGEPGEPDDEDALANTPIGLITGQPALAVADANGVPTSTYSLTNIPVVNATGADAFVVGFIDFNGDGDFDPGEASASVTVPDGATSIASLDFNISGIASGIHGVRLRISSVEADVLIPVGVAADGEVEDHLIEILPVVQTAKVLIPSTAPEEFDLSAGAAMATGGNGAATNFVPFTEGGASPLAISEVPSAPGGNAFVTTALCTDANGVPVSPPISGTSFDTSMISLNGNTAAESTITCTFTNTQESTIAVVKTATPADDTNFMFESTALLQDPMGAGMIPLGNFELDGELVDSADADLLINQISATGSFTDGQVVTFTETVPPGWLLRGASCEETPSGGTTSVVPGIVAPDGLSGSVEVTINPGDTITCNFDNIQLVSVGSQLWFDTNANGVFDAGEAPVEATVNLLDASGAPVLDSASNPITTTTVGGIYNFNDLLPGGYIVEVIPTDTTLVPTPIQASNPDNDVNLDSNIDVANSPGAGTYQSGVVNLTPGTEPTGELDENGVADQPNQTNIDDAAGNMTVDFGFVPPPEIALTKVAGAPTLNDDGTIDVLYTLVIENIGLVDLVDITLVDDLVTQFGPTFFTASDETDLSGGIIDAPAVTELTDAPGTDIDLPTGNDLYDGSALGLFTSDPSTLGVGDSVQVVFTVRLNPAAEGETLNNTATTGGSVPGGEEVEAEAPAMVTLPELEPLIGLTKTAGVPILNDDGTTNVTYTLEIENTGNVDLTNITLVDDLATQFGLEAFTASSVIGDPELGIIAAPVVTSSTDNGILNLVEPMGNADYTGGGAAPAIDLFDATPSYLGVDDILEVMFTVRLNPEAAGLTLTNLAATGGTDPTGSPVTAQDDVDVIIDPLLPEIGLTKSAGEPVVNADGTIDVPYTLIIENIGNVDLTNITLVDDLTTQFGTAAFTASSVAVNPALGIIAAPIVTSSTDNGILNLVVPTGDAAYEGGGAAIDLFDATPSYLGIDDILEVMFTVRLNPAAEGDTLINTATTGGTDPLGEDVNANAPASVTLPELDPSVIIAKSLAGAPIDNGDGSFQVTYNFEVANDGNVDILNLQIVDDLTAMINDPQPNGGSVANAVVSYVSGTELMPNLAYTGTGVNDMLIGTDTYPIGAMTELSLTFDFTPDAYFGPFNNTATVSGTDPNGETVEDNSENAASASPQAPGEDVASPTPFSLDLDPTTPITLGWISITDDLNGSVFIQWQTATEIANAGFHLLVLDESGEWLQVNASMIESQGDSTSPQNYEYLSELIGEEFMLVDVSVRGVEKRHGPFNLNESEGTFVVPEAIDWEDIQQESESKQEQREQERREQLQDRLGSRSNGFLQTVAAALLSVMVPSAHAVDLVSFDVEEAGLYEVTHQDLMTTGLDLRGVELSRLGLEEASVLWPMDKVQNGGTVFTSSTRLLFPARGLESLYAGTNKYTLVLDEGSLGINQDTSELPGDNVALAYSYLAETTYAPQNNYSHLSPESEDSWFADALNAIGSPASKSVTLSVDGYVPPLSFSGGFGVQIQRQATQNPELEVSLWGGSALPGNGVTNPDHNVLLELNGQSLEAVRFDGLALNLDISPLVSVNEGNNVVDITVPNDQGYLYDLIRLDHVTLRYPRTFDAEQNALVFESDWSKFRVANLNTTNASIVRLAQDGTAYYMTERGSGQCTSGCVYFAGQSGVSNSYFVASNAGLKTPTISAAVDGSNLAVGEANFIIISHPDFINTSSQSLEGYASEITATYGSVDIVDVETIYAAYSGGVVDAYAIKAYIDDAYANRGTRHILLVGGDNYDYQDFTNTGAVSFIPSIYQPISNNVRAVPSDSSYVLVDDDFSPDLTISRLPVRSSADLDNLITKRQNYLARNYQNRVLMAADEVDNSNYSFKSGAQDLISNHFASNNVDEVYLDDVDIAVARSQLTSSLNNGVSFASYFGHSSTDRWSIRAMLSGDDVASLINSQSPTVVAQWGCWNTFYVSPEHDSMAHRFLLEGTQGAVTVMGASSFTEADAELRMADLLSANLQQGMSIGDAVMDAKQQIFNENPYQLDVLLGWAVLGFDDMSVFE